MWKVCAVGREIKADWLVIQRWRTESNVFANTILYSISAKHSSPLAKNEEEVPCFQTGPEIRLHVFEQSLVLL